MRNLVLSPFRGQFCDDISLRPGRKLEKTSPITLPTDGSRQKFSLASKEFKFIFTPDRRQSKTLILSTNVDKNRQKKNF